MDACWSNPDAPSSDKGFTGDKQKAEEFRGSLIAALRKPALDLSDRSVKTSMDDPKSIHMQFSLLSIVASKDLIVFEPLTLDPPANAAMKV